MKLIRRLIDFYIDSSIHVALAVCALAGVTILEFNLPWNWIEILFLFTATVTAYNFAKYAGKVGFHHKSLTNSLKGIQLFSLICFVGLLFTAFFQTLSFLWVAGLMAVLVFLYIMPFDIHLKDLRSWGPFKVYIIALVWSVATVLLPMANHLKLWEVELLLKMTTNFTLVLALILPFEIRDLKYDLPELGTIPQKRGIKATKRFGYFLLMGFALLMGGLTGFSGLYFWSGLGIGLVIAGFTFLVKVTTSDYYTSFWLESIPIIWFLILFLPYV